MLFYLQVIRVFYSFIRFNNLKQNACAAWTWEKNFITARELTKETIHTSYYVRIRILDVPKSKVFRYVQQMNNFYTISLSIALHLVHISVLWTDMHQSLKIHLGNKAGNGISTDGYCMRQATNERFIYSLKTGYLVQHANLNYCNHHSPSSWSLPSSVRCGGWDVYLVSSSWIDGWEKGKG